MALSKILGVAGTSFSKIDAIAVASIAKICGQESSVGVDPPVLKGRGYVINASGDINASYANVETGEAPDVGDIVVWCFAGNNGSINSAVLLEDADADDQWYLVQFIDSTYLAGMAYKNIRQSDLDSPFALVGGCSYSLGIWLCFENGAYPFLGKDETISDDIAHTDSNPTGVEAAASGLAAPGIAVSMHVVRKAAGGSITSAGWSGGTPDAAYQINTGDIGSSNAYYLSVLYSTYVAGDTNLEDLTADMDDEGNNHYQAIAAITLRLTEDEYD